MSASAIIARQAKPGAFLRLQNRARSPQGIEEALAEVEALADSVKDRDAAHAIYYVRDAAARAAYPCVKCGRFLTDDEWLQNVGNRRAERCGDCSGKPRKPSLSDMDAEPWEDEP